jgi:Hypothetical glycosyl hydrolase 6/Beta-galactosidase trimerisation domain
MRWSQLTLSERDAQDLDIAFWLGYFAQIKSDGVCLSAGGYVAYYPTDIPFHHRSRWLGDGDPFGLLVEGCRAQGMSVIARTDPHAVHDDVRVAHPEWIQVGADGKPRRHWTMPGAWLACMLGPYNFEFMTEVHKEIASRYDIQGIFTNRWKNIGVCYCASCRLAFQQATGLSLPDTDEISSATYRSYLAWQEDVYLRLVDTWDAAIRGVSSRVRIIPNSGLSRCPPRGTVDLDITRLMRKVDILFADHQGRHGDEPLWSSGKCAKVFSGVAEGRPVGGIFSVGLEGPHRWKDSVQSPAELRVWIAESVANGMRPWWTKFGATVADGRWLEVVKDTYQWLARCEPYLRNTDSLARVALVYSQRMAHRHLEGQCCTDFEAHLDGAYQALIEARIPFDMVSDRHLDTNHLSRFEVVVLPNIAMLSDGECEQLAAFVARGGGVVATHTTSLFDDAGQRRRELGLARLFGVRVGDLVEGPLKNSYLAVRDGGANRSLVAGLQGSSRIINGVFRLPVEPTAPLADAALRLIASYPDLPMEEVYVRDAEPGGPQVIMRQVGAGRIVYFPWDIDRTFWEVLHPDHGGLIARAVQWAGGGNQVVRVEGSGLVDVTVWRQARSLTVHLVNLTNPMSMRGSFREFFPIGPLQVVITVPDGKEVESVRLLRLDAKPKVTMEDGRLALIVPTVVDHEIVAVDLRKVGQ